MRIVYFDLRESNTGRIIDSIRISVNGDNVTQYKRLQRRNGMHLFVIRDGWNTCTYNKQTFEYFKRYEVNYITGKVK